ncbi:MAG: 50S ribosomal protein L4 [Gemmatimonadota bacterium]
MTEATVYTMTGISERQVALPKAWFGAEINRNALYQATRAQRTNDRAGTASTLGRAEVQGGGAKPWRQKGTGRARAGSIRSPLWTGGGVIHGPRPKRWRERVPQRVRQIAFASALTDRAANGMIRVVSLEVFEAPKTTRLAKAVGGWDTEGGKVLVLTSGYDENFALSGRNLPRVTVKQFRDASALDVLLHEIVAVEEGAWETRPVPEAGDAEDESDG